MFTDEKPVDTNIGIEILVNKISVLESDNKELREELAQIQVSIASLVSAIQK